MTGMHLDRRTILGGVAAAALAGRSTAGPTDGVRTRLVLLGTKGGPSPSLAAAEPANLLVVDGEPYLIDCGYGTILQLLKAGYSAAQLRAVFVTHHHFDHNADLGSVVMTAWLGGLNRSLGIVAPTPVKSIVASALAYSEPDMRFRMREEGRKPLAPLLDITEIAAPGVVYQDARVKVSALLVDHWTVKPALAFRFETPDRVIVFSGDTAYDPALADFAKGADILVHEALLLSALGTGGAKGAPTMREHLLRSHTATADVGRIAAAAGVKTLVLTHLVPDRLDIAASAWMAGVREHFQGEVVVGHDLMTV
jgi:ribonuclease BN (tRNA processing enzyme)